MIPIFHLKTLKSAKAHILKQTSDHDKFLSEPCMVNADRSSLIGTIMTYTIYGRIFCTLLGLLLTMMTPLASKAEEPAMDKQTLEVVTRIKNIEATLRTFEARFHQIQKSRMFEDIVESQGVIYYNADGRLRFSVLRPSPFTVLMEGEWITVHDPESNHTQRHHMGPRRNLLKAFFGVGETLDQLNKRFDVRATANAPLPGYTLTMAPKKSLLARKVQQITALVDDRTWLPLQVVIQQSEAEWSRMDLDFISVNKSLPAGAFVLDVEKEPITE
jgi:outer membrane lipoprotein-sorting protein